MKSIHRLLVGLLCVASLLAQGTAVAFAVHAQVPQEQPAMPCHGDAPQAQTGAPDCCDEDCDCFALCAGTAVAIPAPAAALGHLVVGHFEPTGIAATPPSSRGHPRFRPPISIA